VVGIATKPVFHVVLLTPKAKLLDCRAVSVILPCSDGERGILRNHCPLLSELSYGIMQVYDIHEGSEAFFVLEGGFASFSENNLTVLAYDAITFNGVDPEKAKQMISHAQSVIAGQDYNQVHSEKSDMVRSRLILRMAEMKGQKIQPEK
jgi:F-type H+-transporting ATPase subunit epsilon